MPEPKIDKDKLYQLLAEVKSVKQCAEHFNVTPPAISIAKKKLGNIIAKDIQLQSAHRFVDQHLDTVAQLRKINDYAHELLDLLMRWVRGDKEAIQILEDQVKKVRVGDQEEFVKEYKFKDPKDLVFKAMQRIEAQLKLQNETLALLSHMSAVHEFQQELIQILKEVAPEISDEFCRRYDKSRTVQRLLELNKPRA